MIVRGVVVAGRHLGRKLGFPTANIIIDDSIDVDNGVYRSRVRVGKVSYDAISNVGCNPTLGVNSRRIESYIFSFNEDIYGQSIEVELGAYIRKERKFATLEELQTQIKEDIKAAVEFD